MRGGLRRRRLSRRNGMKGSGGKTPQGLGQDVGRRLVQDAWASSGTASWCLSPPVPQSWGSGNPAAKQREVAWRHATARCPKTALVERMNPMDGSGPRGREAMRGANRRGGEKPRGRNVPGEATPGLSEPARPCRRRGEEPQEGMVSAVMPGPGTAEECPERGPSLRELSRAPARDRPIDGRPRGRVTRRGGGGETNEPLRRSEIAPRGRVTL